MTLADLAGFVSDPQVSDDMKRRALALAQSGARGFTSGLLGGPVDIANMMMGGAGGEQPVMGSEWVGDKLEGMGLLSPRQQTEGSSLAELAGGLMNPGGGLKAAASAKPILAGILGGTWYKGMHPHDWTKATKDSPGPLLEPSQINRSSPFPTFGGGDDLTGIRGFFAADPAVASRFASATTSRGAVYPTKIDAERVLTIDAKGAKAGDMQFGSSGKKFQDAVRSGKYDAVVIKNTKDEGDIAVALTGSKISSIFE